MLIREMEEDDISEVIKIEKSLHDDPWSKKVFIDCLDFYDCFVVADDMDEVIIGYGIVSIVLDETRILNIAIKKKYQGFGLGKKLMQHIIDFARISNTDEIFLEVKKSNKKALNLYQKTGFVQIGTRKNYYKTKKGREDAIIMIMEI